MAQFIEGKLGAKQKRFALIVSRFNSFITERLLEGALDALRRSGADDDGLTVIRTPGAFEIPAVARRAVSSDKFDAVVCLGAVIRGATPHFQYVSAEVSKGVAALAADSKIPVTFGVLTTDTIEQAIERAGTKAGNKGWDAAMAAMELVDLYAQLSV
ncbi:MAG: 6,7-dimethyl-8-ribityllumazine synthase [Deltaproteobacteria bacterium]|nr:6,7-dimethyl-8-ribityllumazine synthase [Deltaproteobacteria bacterium]